MSCWTRKRWSKKANNGKKMKDKVWCKEKVMEMAKPKARQNYLMVAMILWMKFKVVVRQKR